MANLKSGLILTEGEELILELEAELWATSNNALARIWGKIQKFLALIMGHKRKGFVVITNKRVVEVRQDILCWVFNAAKNLSYLLPSSVKEIGYAKRGTFLGCFCQQYILFYESFTQRTEVQLTVSDESEAQKVVDAFYKAIASAQ